jgi:hypothetical protein
MREPLIADIKDLALAPTYCRASLALGCACVKSPAAA